MAGISAASTWSGPFNSTGLTKTASRRKLFVCEPEVAERERECAGRDHGEPRAARVPPARGQADLDRLMPFFEEGRKGAGGFDEGIELMTAAVLVEPRLPVSRDRADRRCRPPRARSSALSSSRRGSPSSYGAKAPTTSC